MLTLLVVFHNKFLSLQTPAINQWHLYLTSLILLICWRSLRHSRTGGFVYLSHFCYRSKFYWGHIVIFCKQKIKCRLHVMIFFLFREMLPEMHDKKPAVKTLNRNYACIFGTCVFPRSISYLYACASFFLFLLFLPPACVSEHACIGVSLAV